jgi:hypothetical protein
VRAVREQLCGVGRYYGGQAGVSGAVVAVYTRWPRVPGSEVVKAQLGAALAALHTEAGWARYDSGVDGTGYLTRAPHLASEAGDAYGIAHARK